MSNIFRKSYTLPFPAGAEMVTIKGVPSARFKRKGKTITVPLTEKGDRVRVSSPYYYGTLDGRPVRVFTDAVASQQRLAELVRKSERKESGMADPFEEHRKRPLSEHLDEWAAAIRNDGAGEKHVRASVQSVRRIIEGCKFNRMDEISASRVQQYLADLRRNRPAPAPLDPMKVDYSKSELAQALGVKLTAIPSLIKRHLLGAEGDGKA